MHPPPRAPNICPYVHVHLRTCLFRMCRYARIFLIWKHVLVWLCCKDPASRCSPHLPHYRLGMASVYGGSRCVSPQVVADLAGGAHPAGLMEPDAASVSLWLLTPGGHDEWLLWAPKLTLFAIYFVSVVLSSTGARSAHLGSLR